MKTMVIAALALLALSVGLGIWIGLSGHPYNTVLLTVHKLASIAFVVLCVLYYGNAMRGTSISAGDIALIVLFIVSVAALLATGGIMSAKQPNLFLRIAHIAATGILSVSAGWKLLAYLIG